MIVRWAALILALAGSGALHGQAMNTVVGTMVTTMPTPADPWYGKTTGAYMYFRQLGTHPLYEPGSVTPTGMKSASPAMYPLSTTSSYHNAMTYQFALLVANGVRAANNTQANAKNVKDGADPLVGKGPASLSFWQWLRLGQMGLQVYGKTSAIVKALKSGNVVIDLWKLVPKIAVMSEDDPSAPALVMGLVPYSSSSVAEAERIAKFSDPKWARGMVRFDEMANLVPSLAVKPSFYGPMAHWAPKNAVINQAFRTGRNNSIAQGIMANIHELRTGLSLLNRQMMGRAHGLGDIARTRFSTAYAARMAAELEARADFWDDAFAEISAGARMFGPEFAGQVSTLRGPMTSMLNAERRQLDISVQAKAADTWRAKALAASIANIMLPIETDEYAAGAQQVQDMINKYASDSDPSMRAANNHEHILLGLAVADAWVNRLIHDEIKALRQLYSMNVVRDGTEKLAPYLAQSYSEIDAASRRLTRLQNTLTTLQEGQTVPPGSFFRGDDISRVAERMAVQ